MTNFEKIAFLYLSDMRREQPHGIQVSELAFSVKTFPEIIKIGYRFGVINLSPDREYRLDTRYYYGETCMATPPVENDVFGFEAWYTNDLYVSQMSSADPFAVNHGGYYSMVATLMGREIQSSEEYRPIDKYTAYFAVSDSFKQMV